MEIKRIDDLVDTNTDLKERKVESNVGSKVSDTTKEALQMIDANIRNAEQKAGTLIVA